MIWFLFFLIAMGVFIAIYGLTLSWANHPKFPDVPRPRLPVLCVKQHFKEIGEPVPDNMKTAVYFIEEGRQWGYTILECEACGKRAFLSTTHMLEMDVCRIIDRFIDRKITLDDLKANLLARNFEITEEK